VFGASGVSLFVKVILPATLPFGLVGLRRGVALGFIGRSSASSSAARSASARRRGWLSSTSALIMVLATNVAFKGIDLTRRRLAPWHREGPTSGG